jgi:hypothetical protein
MARETDGPNLLDFLTSPDALKFHTGNGRGSLLIQPIAKDSFTDPSRWLILPRGTEGLIEPVLETVEQLRGPNSVTVINLPSSEGKQPQYALRSRSILDTVDYLGMLTLAIMRFDSLDTGKLTQEEVTTQVCEYLSGFVS